MSLRGCATELSVDAIEAYSADATETYSAAAAEPSSLGASESYPSRVAVPASFGMRKPTCCVLGLGGAFRSMLADESEIAEAERFRGFLLLGSRGSSMLINLATAFVATSVNGCERPVALYTSQSRIKLQRFSIL